MLARKEQKHSAIYLPQEWKDKVEALLNNIYAAQCERDGKTFQVYGLTYPDEVYLTVSYLDPKMETSIPVTYIISCDLEKQNEAQKLIDILVDSIGVFFDDYFSKDEWNDYNPVWTESVFKKQKFFYQVNRENIALTIQADQLLNQ